MQEDEASATVAFEMITDDLNRTQVQLDSIRARKPKFICVNDDMEAAPPETRKALHDFYESLFPLPSQFELPEGETNPILHFDSLVSGEQSPHARHWLFVGLMLFVLCCYTIVRLQRMPL